MTARAVIRHRSPPIRSDSDLSMCRSSPLAQSIAQPPQRLLGVLAGPAGVVIELGALRQADPQLVEAVQPGGLPAAAAVAASAGGPQACRRAQAERSGLTR